MEEDFFLRLCEVLRRRGFEFTPVLKPSDKLGALLEHSANGPGDFMAQDEADRFNAQRRSIRRGTIRQARRGTRRTAAIARRLK